MSGGLIGAGCKMMGMQEIYVLRDDRSAGSIHAFLDRFLPERVSLHEDYPVPENADSPREILRSEEEILRYLEENRSEPYGLYWGEIEQGSLRQAMAFYTRDGKVILGLAEAPERSVEFLRQLSSFAGTGYALMGTEQRPPETAREFIALCRRGV